MKRSLVLLAFLAVAFQLTTADAATRYNFRRLSTFTGVPVSGSGSSYAYGINDLGHIVGRATNPGSSIAQAFFCDGLMIAIPVPTTGSAHSYAYGINDAGVVAAYYSAAVPPAYAEAFTWQSTDGTVTRLGHLGPSVSGTLHSYAFGINDSTSVVGQSSSPGGFQAFLHTNGSMSALAGLPYNAVGRAIDANGNIVGSGTNQAFVLTSGGSLTWLGFLGNPGSGSGTSYAYGINDALQVVGYTSSPTTTVEAFIWSPAQGMQSLGDLPGGTAYSIAYGVNNSGQVVGASNSASGQEAFVWDAEQGMVSLNALVDGAAGWFLHEARAINNGGQIVGYGRNPLGGYEAFVLTPAPAESPAIAFVPASFTFTAPYGGPNPANDVLYVENSQTGTLDWTVSESVSWLSLSPTSGQGNGTVTLSVAMAGLPAGTYVTNILISGNALNSPQSVPVTLNVTAAPPPTIGVAPASLAWNLVEGNTTAVKQQLTISNTGGSNMIWLASPDQAWISVLPSSGFIASGAYTLADVNVNPTGKTPGAYAGNVSIAANGATNTPQVVPVGMTILPAITVTYPNGGETLRYAQNVTVTWDASTPAQTVAKTDAHYSTDGGATWKLIKSQTGLKANCAWKVPRLNKPSANCLVRVQFKDAAGAVIAEDRSDAAFTITK